MNIMNVVYYSGILRNDLSYGNIMLHFSHNKLDVVYIGVCDWGEIKCMQEAIPYLYVFAKEQDAVNMKETHWWVALKLFFVHGESITTNSLLFIMK
jgi:hypothetical protein